MPIVNDSLISDYIASAKLPAPPARSRGRPRGAASLNLAAPPLELADTDAQGLVVGSGLIVAAENVPAKTRGDLVNCTLFAQLAASGTVPDTTKVTDWYREYFKALAVLGWAQTSQQFEEYKSKTDNLEVHKSIISLLGALLGPKAAAVVTVAKTLDALQSMDENNPWIALFNRSSTAVKSSRFQVAAAQRGAGGLLEIALAAFELKASKELTQVLFFKFRNSSTKLKYAQGTATIYEAALAGHRAQIAQRLTAYQSDYIGAVKFPPP
jgi:hypothetical protein